MGWHKQAVHDAVATGIVRDQIAVLGMHLYLWSLIALPGGEDAALLSVSQGFRGHVFAVARAFSHWLMLLLQSDQVIPTIRVYDTSISESAPLGGSFSTSVMNSIQLSSPVQARSEEQSLLMQSPQNDLQRSTY